MQKASRGVRQLQEFGDRVRAYRLKKDLSQEELAELAGMHRTYVGHIERGEVNLTLVNVLKLAAALGVDAGQLVKGMAQRLGDPKTV